ncbi:MAG: flagellar motor protein MotB [Desulfobacterales bacterium]|nr:flagellar motor protein MotB [Desulfobacterales bacterium]
MKPTIKTALILLTLSFFLSACVSKGKYENIETRLADAEKENSTASSALQALEKEKEDCLKLKAMLLGANKTFEKENEQLEETIQNQQYELDKRDSIIKIQENVIDEIEKTRKDIEARLKDQIASMDVKIETLEGKLKVTFVDKLLFNSGSADIKQKGRAVLKEIGISLLANDSHNINVEGHTDNVAIGASLQKRFPTNWELSTARATAVVRYLIEDAGLTPERLSASGYSYFHPVAPNDTAEGKMQNRRIEIILEPK